MSRTKLVGPLRFTPTTNFDCPENSSSYCAGLSYTAKEGNEPLLALVEQWLEQGLVVVEDPNAPRQGRARIGGRGIVS